MGLAILSSDHGDVLNEEVQGYAPPIRRRYSPLHEDGIRPAHGDRRERRDSPLQDRRRPAYSDKGERTRHSREQRRCLAPIKPDHAINPSKWTKYNLANDGTKGLLSSGMSSDQINKYAALEFLKKRKGLRRESEGDEEEEKEEESGGKMIFKKPAKKDSMRGRCEGVEEEEGKSGRGGLGGGAGVCMMPEYNVGWKEEEGKGNKGRGRKKLVVLGQRLDKRAEDEVKEKVRGVREKKGRHGVSLGHLEDEEEEIQ